LSLFNLRQFWQTVVRSWRSGRADLLPGDDSWGRDQTQFAPPEYGEYIARSVGVYACVTLRADNLRALPLRLYKGQGEKRKEVTTGRLYELLQKVNPFWSLPDLVEYTEHSLSLWGRCFWALERGATGKGTPTEIWWLRPDRVRVRVSASGYISGYVYEHQGTRIHFDASEVIFLRYANVLDEFNGLSPIAAARLSIDLGTAGLKSNQRLFDQGMQLGGIISPVDKDTQWSKESARGLEDMLTKRFKGMDKAHKWAVLTQQINAQALGVNPKDAEFLGQMRWSLADVCRVYRVSPILVQDTTDSTYSNYEQALKALWELTLVPEANRIANAITEQLLPMFPGEADTVEFDVSGVKTLQEGEDSRWTREQGQIAAGAMTINEWRRDRGKKPVPWGDVWWAVGSRTAIDAPDDTTQPEPPAPPATGDPAEPAARALSLIVSLLAWEFGGEQHATAWKAFDSEATKHEAAWAKVTRGLFEDQEAEILAALEGNGKGYTSKRVHSNPFDKAGWVRRFAEAGVGLLRTVVKDAGKKVYAELGIGGAFDVAAPQVTRFIQERAQRFATRVNDTTWDRLKTSLADGEASGETIDQLKVRVSDIMRGRIKSDSETIARTEVIGGLNGGALEAAKASGVVKSKRWLAALDDRTRDTHAATHGEVVPLDADFSLGGPAPGQIPDPAESINCRCTLVFEVDDSKRFSPDTLKGLREFARNGHTS
jgi:HK97 family phage portal protein